MNNRLKILFLSNRIPFPIKDGQSRRTYNILRGLAGRNDIYFLSLYESIEEIDPQTIDHLKSFCDDVEYIISPSKKISFQMVIRLLRSLVSSDPYTVWRHYSSAYIKRIQDLLKERKFDLIHCDILPLAKTIQRVKTIPCTLTDHDVCYLKALRISEQSRNLLLRIFMHFESFKLKNFERKIFKQISMGITVSEIDKKILSVLCPEGNFTVIENGVDTDTFRPADGATEANSLLWVGGFGYSPNREAIYYFLKEIYPLVKKKAKNVKINIVGDGVTKKLKSLSAGDSSINIIGYVDDPIPYIQKATAFIVPILSGSGTRLKTLEAMSAAKAIVTTSVGCEGIDGIDKIHYLIADRPLDFANSIIELFNNPNLQQKLGVNARRLATQKYDWKIVSEKINNLYKNMMGDISNN